MVMHARARTKTHGNPDRGNPDASASKERQSTSNPHAAFDWRIHCGVEVTELSTNKQHTLSEILRSAAGLCVCSSVSVDSQLCMRARCVTVHCKEQIAADISCYCTRVQK
jgi:hypothetical protein